MHAVEPPDGDGGRGGVAAAGAVLKYRILSIEIADFSEVRAHVFNVLSRDSAWNQKLKSHQKKKKYRRISPESPKSVAWMADQQILQLPLSRLFHQKKNKCLH